MTSSTFGPTTTGGIPIALGASMDYTNYTWMAMIAILFSFIAAYGIGANDVANAFATSVGAGSLTLRQAVVIAAIFELGGVVLMGSGVTETVRKGITNGEMFADEPYVLAFGMMCVCISVAFWLLVATKWHLPVSTTHTAIGSIIGMAITAKGWNAVNWSKVYMVIASWFLSPILSGVIALLFYLIVRSTILRSENPAERTIVAYPFLVAFTTGLVCFYTLFKGSPKYKKQVKNLPLWGALLIGFGAALFAGLLVQCIMVPRMKAYLQKIREENEDEEIELPGMKHGPDRQLSGGLNRQLSNSFKDIRIVRIEANRQPQETEEGLPPVQFAGKETRLGANLDDVVLQEPGAEKTKKKSWIDTFIPDLDEKFKESASGELKEMLGSAESHNSEAEKMFTYLQVATCCFDAFAHGANDVANSIGPLAACYGIWEAHKETGILSVPDSAEVPIWMLLVGGLGIVAGLATYGYHIILTIGFELTKLSPSRGFIIELSSALVILTGSRLKLPLSTTHCQVGATIGMGLSEGCANINWWLMSKVFAGWVATVVVSALFTSAIFSYAIYSPKV